ncbi:MAG: phosphotransferase [Saprospiraceae bacterium]|nr:phosphotransferase [Saprospiraceae bacterium]
MQQVLIQHISNLLGTQILDTTPVSGGDISQAYRIDTNDKAYFVKTNPGHSAFSMFEAEKKGLEAILSSNTIAVPEVLLTGEFQGQSFLVMEMLEHRRATPDDYEKLGYQLAHMHLVSSPRFGFDDDNYIGSLPQKNNWHNKWTDFYIHCRLVPQLEMALSRSLISQAEIPPARKMEESLEALFEGIKPSLLHGDLWNGNYLIEKTGTPYLIDPAVYYGHCEVDIAMTKLFGGFGDSFYQAYHTIIPLDDKSHARIEVYKLYYLLVHLNLFGRSYYPQVKRIMETYFN